jgi:murein DD-endopeptidase MepM/ murein hydrolase activator NlpD
LVRSAPLVLLSVSFSIPALGQSEFPLPLEPPEVGVPFGCGMSFPVSQVHNAGSHVSNDAWAWDFRMPEGTPVVAALDGVVRLARGDSEEGGCDPSMARKANYVVLEHAHGLETQYLHFSVVSVTPGRKVRRGDLLGYSGKTGWACGAHLHFKVAVPVSAGWNNPSVEARLAGFGDPALETWVSSLPCVALPAVAEQREAPAPHPESPPEVRQGTVAPASLASGSPSQAGAPLGPALGAVLEHRAAAGGLTPSRALSSAPQRGGPPPVEHPLSAGGSALAPSAPPSTTAMPLGPRLPAPAPALPAAGARPPVGVAHPSTVHDTEAELLESSGPGAARR